MIIRRIYSPEQIAALRRDIRKRYTRKCEVGKRTRPMAAIRIAELTRWLDHTHGNQVPDDDQGEIIARIMVHHLITLRDGSRRAAQWLDHHTPWLTIRSREALISEASHHPLKWTARKLGWKIRLTDATRTTLKITTIAPIDVTDDQLKARRKARQAELQRARRARLKAMRQQHIG